MKRELLFCLPFFFFASACELIPIADFAQSCPPDEAEMALNCEGPSDPIACNYLSEAKACDAGHVCIETIPNSAIFECQKGIENVICQADQIKCNNSCVNPMISNDHCGAKGECSDVDVNSPNFSGLRCNKDTHVCQNGACNRISCDNVFESLCPDMFNPGQTFCVNANSDPDNCGFCASKCNSDKYPNATGTGCVAGTCRYQCKEAYTNCTQGDDADIAPLCVSNASFQFDANHCGECNKQCSDNLVCKQGDCVDLTCTPNTLCPNIDCQNTDESCGARCLNCNALENVRAGKCHTDLGSCEITNCIEDYHLSKLGAGNTCVPNLAESCAASNSFTTKDCTSSANSKVSKCTPTGECMILECAPNYHLSSAAANNTCVINSATSCGLPNALGANCQSIISDPNALAFTCTGEGKCQIRQCKANFHISNDRSACVPNSGTACGTTTGTGVDCKTQITDPNSISFSCLSGICSIVECAPNYHISSTAKQCIRNTNTACALPTSKTPIACTTGFDCRMGVCTNSTNTSSINCAGTTIPCLNQDSMTKYCSPSSTPPNYNCAYLCNSINNDQTYCGKNKCIVLVNGATCSACPGSCKTGATCFKRDLIYTCQ